MYICKYCGREFEKQQGWASHECKCKLNPNRDKALKHLEYVRSCKKERRYNQKDNKIYNCQYCLKECNGIYSLKTHERLCKNNPNRQNSNFIKYNEECRSGKKHHPHKGQTKNTSESLRKMVETRRKRLDNGEIKGSFTNHHHSKESKEKMCISALKYLKSLKNIKSPRYNKSSIKYIDNLNETKNWNLQHAENGGEFQIGGYFLDEYDKELNIAFEYDESNHYIDSQNNILCERDKERQNYIIEKLKCEFWRYNEEMDILYRVN